MPKLNPETEWLYVRSMGKALRVVAWFTNDDDANAFIANSRECVGVVACFGPLILLAGMYDKGITIPKEGS